MTAVINDEVSFLEKIYITLLKFHIKKDNERFERVRTTYDKVHDATVSVMENCSFKGKPEDVSEKRAFKTFQNRLGNDWKKDKRNKEIRFSDLENGDKNQEGENLSIEERIENKPCTTSFKIHEDQLWLEAIIGPDEAKRIVQGDRISKFVAQKILKHERRSRRLVCKECSAGLYFSRV